MHFQRVKNWGLALLVLILLTFAALAHTESRLYLKSMHTMHALYHPLLHRVTQLNSLLKSTEINFEIFRRRDIPQLATNAEAINRLSDRIQELKASSSKPHLPLIAELESESQTISAAWKRFESVWRENQDLSSDSIHQWVDILSESLEELKWKLIGLRDISSSYESIQLVSETMTLTKSITEELDTFVTQEPIFIEEVLEPLSNVPELLKEFDEQASLLESGNIDAHHAAESSMADHGAHDHVMPKTSGSHNMDVDNGMDGLEAVRSINKSALNRTKSLQAVLHKIQSTADTDSGTYRESIELARKLITEIENQFSDKSGSLQQTHSVSAVQAYSDCAGVPFGITRINFSEHQTIQARSLGDRWHTNIVRWQSGPSYSCFKRSTRRYIQCI